MKICIEASFSCLWEEIEASVKADLSGEAADFIDEYSLLKETEKTFILVCNLNSFDAFIKWIHKPNVQEVYNSMGVKLKIYSMSLMER